MQPCAAWPTLGYVRICNNIFQFFPSGSLDEDDSGDDALTYQSSFHSIKTRKCAIPVPANQADTEREANSLSIELGEPMDGENQADSFRKELEETSPAHEEDVESFSEELAELAEVAPSDILSTSAETRATNKSLESSSSVILAQAAGLSKAVYSAHTADSTASMELVTLGISTKRMKFSEGTESVEMAPSVHFSHLAETHATTRLLESTSMVILADSAKTSEAVFSVQPADLTTSTELVVPVKSPERMELSGVGESFEADVLSNLIDSVHLTTTIIPTQLVPSMVLPDSTEKTESAQLAESINLTTSPEATPADTCVSTKNANIAQMKAILSSFELPDALKIKGRRPSLSHAPMIAIKEENDDEHNDL